MNTISNVYNSNFEKKKNENSSIFRESNLKQKLENLFINPNYFPNKQIKYNNLSNKNVKFMSFDSPNRNIDINSFEKNTNKDYSYNKQYHHQNSNPISPSIFSEQNIFKRKKKISMDTKDNYDLDHYFGSIGKNVMNKENSKSLNKIKSDSFFTENEGKEDNNDFEIGDYKDKYNKGKKKNKNLYLKKEDFEKEISNKNYINEHYFKDNQKYFLNSDRDNYNNKSLFNNSNSNIIYYKNNNSFNFYRKDSENLKKPNISNFNEIINLKNISKNSINKYQSEKKIPKILLYPNLIEKLENNTIEEKNEKNEKNHHHSHHHNRNKKKHFINDNNREIESYENKKNENKNNQKNKEIKEYSIIKEKIDNNQNKTFSKSNFNPENNNDFQKEKVKKMKHKLLSNPQLEIKKPIIENKIKSSYIYSKAGRTEDEKEKINQDSFLKIEHINGFEDFNIYGIFDGHGSSGHLVSQFIVHYLTEYYKYNEEILKKKTIESIYSLLKKKNYLFIKESIKKSEEALFDSDEIDSTFSGTTCILIFIIGTKIISVNIGDSRAIMLNEKKKIIELSIDQKPENLEEKERIEKNGGEIRKIIENNEEIGPMRVWAKGKKYPGIAMSRSIGDSVANEIGVWSLPDIKEYNIQYNSQFIVIGSDGLWEFMSNDKVCKFVYKCKNKSHIQDYLEKLVEKSRKYWEKYDCNIDDITVILITFNYFYKEDNENED